MSNFEGYSMSHPLHFRGLGVSGVSKIEGSVAELPSSICFLCLGEFDHEEITKTIKQEA